MSKKIELLFFYSIIALVFTCCSSPSSNKDKMQYRIINKDTMIQIMAECYIAEGEIFHAPEDSDKQAVCTQLYSNIFHKHGITKEEYIANSDYYMKQEEESDIMLQAVMSKVDAIRATVNKNEQ